MAHFEHASIAAFEMLATELAQHSAPVELIEAARAAAADEARHTTIRSELARRFGAIPTTSDVAAREARSQAIALESATEGLSGSALVRPSVGIRRKQRPTM